MKKKIILLILQDLIVRVVTGFKGNVWKKSTVWGKSKGRKVGEWVSSRS